MTGSERFGGNLREWRLRRRLTQEQLGALVGSDGPRIGRLEKGAENPTLESIDKLGVALEVDVSAFHLPRPEEGEADEQLGERSALLDRRFPAYLRALDTEAPAEDSWRGDILKAIAALTRALRREDSGATAGPTAKTGR